MGHGAISAGGRVSLCLSKRSDRVVLEADPHYWDRTRMPRVKRIVFDNTLSQQEAVELVKTTEGRVDLVSGLRPLDTLRVAAESLGHGGEEPGESHARCLACSIGGKRGAHGTMCGCARP